MSGLNYDEMDLDELERYIAEHQDDTAAYYAFIDRAILAGQMSVINVSEPGGKEKLYDLLRPSNPDELN